MQRHSKLSSKQNSSAPRTSEQMKFSNLALDVRKHEREGSHGVTVRVINSFGSGYKKEIKTE